MFSYRTISEPVAGGYREKGSKFIAFAYPVVSESEIRHHLDMLRKEYFDARHHCYAWMLGAGKEQFRAYDDGEPNHSAGDPILGQIRSHNLTNVLVVVVRYFGGVKLGVGGLVNAYRTAAADALKNATIIEKEVTTTFTIDYDYTASAEVMRLVKEFDLKVVDQIHADRAVITVLTQVRRKNQLRERLALLKALNRDILFTEL